MSLKNKIIVTVILIVVIVFAFIYLRKDSNSNSGVSLVAENKLVDFSGARDILDLLNRMTLIKLDDSIFNDKIFIGLKDTTVVLVEQPTGRNNPFAPLGTDGVRIATTTTIKVGR